MDIKKILIVDDDEVTLKLLEQQLTCAGYPVLKAKNGKEAVEVAKTKKPALILLDVMMPEVDGANAAQTLKEDPATKNIPIVFLTGILTKKEEAKMGRDIGGNIFLAKPYNREELLEIVQRHI